MRTALLSVLLLALAACGGDAEIKNDAAAQTDPAKIGEGKPQPYDPAADDEPGPSAPQPSKPQAELVAEMNAAIESLMNSPEHGDEKIRLQHVLVGFDGARATELQPRSKQDAEYLAAEIFAAAKAGRDFKALMKQHSDDPGPGTYDMTKKGRGQMVKSFGDVGFRLQPGMVGVAPYDKQHSPFGWHVIKRIE